MARVFIDHKLGFGSIFKRVKGDTVLANLYIKFKGKEYPVGSPRVKDAERLLCKLRGDFLHEDRQRQKGVKRVVLVSELFDDLLSDYREKQRATLQDAGGYINNHLAPVFADMRCDDLATPDVKAYVRQRLKEGAKNATINRELAILKRAFRLGYTHYPPKVERLPHIEMLPEDNVRKGFVVEEQYRALRDNLPPYLRPLLVVAYHVGNRKGELLGLLWSQVELDAEPPTITLWSGTTKNKKGRTLPIYGEMLDCLREQKRLRDQKYPKCAFVFHLDGQPLQSFRKAWATACKKAGAEGLLFHDLRRSAVRNLTRAGVPRPQAMAITGHKTESVYVRYDIVDFQDLRDAAAKMERFHDGQRQPEHL